MPPQKHPRKRIPGPAWFFLLAPILGLLALAGCNIVNSTMDDDWLDNIDAEIAWANAPWVPLRIELRGLGTSALAGPQDRVVRKGFSFTLVFQPSANIPFRGWQAWTEAEGPISSWRNDDDGGQERHFPERVRFVPRNGDGSEVEIFVHELPPDGAELFIGPHGALNHELEVFVTGGGLGSPFPSGPLAGVRQDFPFAVSFEAAAGFPFRGWRMERGGEQVASWRPDGDGGAAAVANAPGWDVLWEPRNASGTEMEMTVRVLPGDGGSGHIMVTPYGAQNALLDVKAIGGGLGTTFPSGAIAARRDFSFAVNFQPAAGFPFRGWQMARGGVQVASWRAGGAATTESVPGWEVLWEARNASGTDMGVTIRDLPGGDGTITVMPYGALNEELEVFVSGGGLGAAFPSGTMSARRDFSFAVNFQPAAGFPFRGWQMIRGGEPVAGWRPDGDGGLPASWNAPG